MIPRNVAAGDHNKSERHDRIAKCLNHPEPSRPLQPYFFLKLLFFRADGGGQIAAGATTITLRGTKRWASNASQLRPRGAPRSYITRLEDFGRTR